MKVTINDRDYELKELTKEEAKEYIGKEVYVWNSYEDEFCIRKLLVVFEPFCEYPFCVLSSAGTDTYNFRHCAPVPEEWYVQQLPDGTYESICPDAPRLNTIDHGSKEYCEQKARELNDKEKPCSECRHEDEPMAVCSGCGDNKSKFARKIALEHSLTNYELSQLMKCFGVDLSYNKEIISNIIISYVNENEALSNGYKIRYKRGNWMPATRETVMKWVEENKADMFDEVKYFVRFMGWDKE